MSAPELALIEALGTLMQHCETLEDRLDRYEGIHVDKTGRGQGKRTYAGRCGLGVTTVDLIAKFGAGYLGSEHVDIRDGRFTITVYTD